jgi:hypothetical protein
MFKFAEISRGTRGSAASRRSGDVDGGAGGDPFAETLHHPTAGELDRSDPERRRISATSAPKPATGSSTPRPRSRPRVDAFEAGTAVPEVDHAIHRCRRRRLDESTAAVDEAGIERKAGHVGAADHDLDPVAGART